MNFFFDANISHKIPQMLEIFDPRHNVLAHRDYFDDGTSDIDWMRSISNWEEPPVVVCGDSRILRNSVERQVLKDANLTIVFLAKGWTNLSWEEQAWKFVKCWPDIVKAVSRVRRPSVFEVRVNNLKVELKGALSDL